MDNLSIALVFVVAPILGILLVRANHLTSGLYLCSAPFCFYMVQLDTIASPLPFQAYYWVQFSAPITKAFIALVFLLVIATWCMRRQDRSLWGVAGSMLPFLVVMIGAAVLGQNVESTAAFAVIALNVEWIAGAFIGFMLTSTENGSGGGHTSVKPVLSPPPLHFPDPAGGPSQDEINRAEFLNRIERENMRKAQEDLDYQRRQQQQQWERERGY